MNIHVLTPLYRVHLISTLVHYLEPMHIEWHPIMTEEEVAKFNPVYPRRDWIHPLVVKNLLPGQNAFTKINSYKAKQDVFHKDYYAFMCDDNMYEPFFFDVIRQQNAKIIICSLYRGDRVPVELSNAPPHPASTIHIRNFNDIRPGNIDIMQYVIRGDIFKENDFDEYDHGFSDGHYAVRLKEKYPNDIVILSNLFGFFNYFQPGRYTKPEALLEAHWKMPTMIGGAQN